MNAFENAVETFLKGASNLGDAELPLVVALRETAKTLDSEGVQASLVNQFRLIMNALYERTTSEGKVVDPLEALLEGRN